MRYVAFDPQKPPPPKLVSAARAAAAELEAAKDKAARDSIIDTKSKADKYRAFREWLGELSGKKCWFTEADDKAAHFEVEHYRPKKVAKDLQGNEREGYWWLTFDWQNLRLSGNIPNRKKGGFFPLKPGCACATADARGLSCEEPYLLDPAVPRDPQLLDFDEEGKARPSALAVRNAWDKERAEVSIDRYGLLHPQLEEGRKQLWNQMSREVFEYLNCLNDGSSRAHGRADQLIVQIIDKCRPTARFSRAARAYLRTLDRDLAQQVMETI